MKKSHQGNEFKLLLKGRGLAMGDVAETLGMSRQNLSYHLRKDILDEDFKRLVFDKLQIDFPNVKKENKIVNMGTEKEEILTALAFGYFKDFG